MAAGLVAAAFFTGAAFLTAGFGVIFLAGAATFLAAGLVAAAFFTGAAFLTGATFFAGAFAAAFFAAMVVPPCFLIPADSRS